MTQPNTNNSDEDMGASATPKLAKTALSKHVETVQLTE